MNFILLRLDGQMVSASPGKENHPFRQVALECGTPGMIRTCDPLIVVTYSIR